MNRLAAVTPQGGAYLFDIVRRRALALAACVTLAALWFIQFTYVRRFYVDVPYRDEWDALVTLSPQFTSSAAAWIFMKHGDHMIALTKIFYLAPLSTVGLNFRTLAQVNFVIFGALVVLVIFVLCRLVRTVPFYVIAAFTAFTLSARAWENHGSTFQNQLHFNLFFFFLACYLLFAQRTLWRNALAGVCCILSSVSFGTGLPMVLVLGLVHLVSIVVLDPAEGGGKRVSRLAMAAITTSWMIAVVAISAAFWSATPGQRLTFPNDLRFWQYLFTMVSSGFGIDVDSVASRPALAASGVPGLICLVVILAPCGYSLYRAFRAGELRSFPFGLLAMTAGLLAAVAVISIGRSGWWQDGSDGKASRYTEITMFLLPICAAWYWAILPASRIRLFVLAALFAVVFVLFADDWRYKHFHAGFLEPRKAGVACIARYYLGGERALCSSVYDSGSITLEPYLDFFKDMNFTFVRTALRRG
jgi:hypothetical protein